MQSVLTGFILIWISSFLIFAWMIWRAPVLEEILDEGEKAPQPTSDGERQTA